MSQSNQEAKILLALQAIQKDPKLSTWRAARIYTVPETTLRRRLTGIPSRAGIRPNSRKLSDLEEQTISRYILDLDSRGFPPRLAGIKEIAN